MIDECLVRQVFLKANTCIYNHKAGQDSKAQPPLPKEIKESFRKKKISYV